jgi:superfamily II DNA helicase RecQ
VYSVEDVNEKAMTEFIPSRTCRRKVLSRHFDEESEGVDCHSIDRMFCNKCKGISRKISRKRESKVEVEEEAGLEDEIGDR